MTDVNLLHKALPWTRNFVGGPSEFLTELRENISPLLTANDFLQFIYEWMATAEVHADQEAYALLTGPMDIADFVDAPRPGVPSDEDVLIAEIFQERDAVKAAMDVLSTHSARRSLLVLTLYLRSGRTMRDLAPLLGITQARVGQLVTEGRKVRQREWDLTSHAAVG